LLDGGPKGRAGNEPIIGITSTRPISTCGEGAGNGSLTFAGYPLPRSDLVSRPLSRAPAPPEPRLLGLLLRLPYFAIYETENAAMLDDDKILLGVWMFFGAFSVVMVLILMTT
jgi:hypothetical protein